MVVVIIPSRLSSSRLPRKALCLVRGKTVIQRCYEGCLGSSIVDKVYVTTPDEEIADTVKSFGGRVIMTGKYPTALDRCSEAVEQLMGYKTAVVVLGDEPMVRYEMIDLALRENEIATCLVTKLGVDEDPQDPNILKVLFDKRGYFIYLSRSVLPGVAPHKGERPPIYKQVCVMAFDVKLLAQYKEMERGPIESSEDIEILRYIEHGYRVMAIESPYDTRNVDVMDDLVKVRRMLA